MCFSAEKNGNTDYNSIRRHNIFYPPHLQLLHALPSIQTHLLTQQECSYLLNSSRCFPVLSILLNSRQLKGFLASPT